jgi:hypothetical protein
MTHTKKPRPMDGAFFVWLRGSKAQRNFVVALAAPIYAGDRFTDACYPALLMH